MEIIEKKKEMKNETRHKNYKWNKDVRERRRRRNARNRR